ncbi:hypothetical protein QTP70_032223, partial [Hemibagrus guttatus]
MKVGEEDCTENPLAVESGPDLFDESLRGYMNKQHEPIYLHGEPVPKGQIYSLSIPEERAMEEYIQEALSQGYIRPSTSPAASSFFFVAKKDGGLRPCIDYRALNQITVKFRYPLPLVPSALERLCGATVFTKLDLRSTYNLIRIREGDEWKTAFMTPTGHYEYLVMPYRLANAPSVFQDFMHTVLREFLHKSVLVYIDDILIYSRNLAEHRRHVEEVLQRLRDYQLFLKAEKCTFHQSSVHFLGSITSPLTNLLRNKPKSLTWNPAATQAFDNLKTVFTTAPLLAHPDPELPFIVEVDVSTTGVGAVLSQQQGSPRTLHPCAYFSQKLSLAEVSYDIGNLELPAIKLALEEWRHWLEGAKHPFVVLTNHKNLEYLRAAKRLNLRQARWALFFTRFQFTISYRPGPKNIKADALSRLHGREEPSDEPEPILPEKLFASPISWSEEMLPEPSAPTSAPPGCPPGLRFIPRTQRSERIHCAHTSLGTGHPGTHRTLSILKQRFWWPGMASDVRSPAAYFPCQGTPPPLTPQSAFLTMYSVTMAYRRTSYWTGGRSSPPESGKRLGVTVSLSSGYHPQTNGQTERKIQEVGHFLRTFYHDHQEAWSQFLGWAEYAQNSLRQPTTGLTPFQCVLGYQPPLFPWDGEPSDVPAVDYWFRESERVWDSAHRQLQRALRRRRTTADLRRSKAPEYRVGQKVWLSTRDIRMRLPCRKLSPRFIGPFTITRQINPVTYQPGEVEEPPSPLIMDEGSAYLVKDILDSRRGGGCLEYLVDWEGYGPEERSWVPRNDILDPALLRTSMSDTPIGRLHEAEADHHDVGVCGPQERTVEGG